MPGLVSGFRCSAGKMVLHPRICRACRNRQLCLRPPLSGLIFPRRSNRLLSCPINNVWPFIMMDNNPHQSTIGILYPGEMGSSFGKLLCEIGFRVVTTVEGRSPRTHRLCHEAGLSVLDSLGEVLARSNVVISLVSPGAALAVARDVAAHLEGSSRSLLYIDANSISPMTVARISEALCQVPVDFVDASIIGLASQLRQRGTLYLSGSRAKELSGQFEPIMRVKVVGDMPGQASALRMIVSGITKGLSGLFIETMLFAQEMHLLKEAIEACDEIYPSIMELFRR